MKKPPARWRDLHPGDMVKEPSVTLSSLTKAADQLSLEGYSFIIEAEDDGFLVTCIESPRPLIGDRP